jgi:molybdopterin-guanine dinucleotide biosynthesis protein A
MTAAILLAGGRASRVGGAAKPLFEIAGSTLLERAVQAVSGCSPVIVVGDAVAGIDDVVFTREEPPFGGPGAAVVWALDRLHDEPEFTYLLGCDLPGAGDAVRRLEARLAALPADVDGLCLADGAGRPQWLIAAYRTAALRRTSARPGASMQALLAPLHITTIPAPESETMDVDTWHDLANARRREAAPMNDRTLPPESLDEWAQALKKLLGLDDDLPTSLILDLAREVANAVARPAAPLSAFAAGLAAGRAGGSPDDIRAAITAITARAGEWRR